MCFTTSSCCCCLSLDAGAKIISVLFTLSSICTLFVYGPLAALNESLPPARLYFYSCLAVLAVFEIGIGIMLIRGVFKRKPHLTWPWIVLAWWKGVILSTLSVAGSVALAMSSDLSLVTEVGPVIAVYFVYSVLLLYLATVVNSRRQELVEENDMAHRYCYLRHRYYYI